MSKSLLSLSASETEAENTLALRPSDGNNYFMEYRSMKLDLDLQKGKKAK